MGNFQPQKKGIMLFPQIKFRVIVNDKLFGYEFNKNGFWTYRFADNEKEFPGVIDYGILGDGFKGRIHREIFLRKDAHGQDVYENDIIRMVEFPEKERVVYFDQEKDLIFSDQFIESWEKCGSVRKRIEDDVIEGKFRWYRDQCNCKFGKRNFGSNNLNCSGFDSERPGSRWPRPKFHPEDPSADHWFPLSFNPRWMISKCARRQQKTIK